MKKKYLLIITVILASIVYIIFFNRLPDNNDKLKEAYYYCEQCDALYGGRLTKGPTRSFRKPGSYFDVHSWKPISKSEFKQIAAEIYNIKWENEPESFFNGRWEMYEKQRQGQD